MKTPYASSNELAALLKVKQTWLFDADDTTWKSEVAAFAGCCKCVNRYLSSSGSEIRFTPAALMEAYRGLNAKAIFSQVAADYNLPINDEKLISLVAEELDTAINELRLHCEAAPGIAPVLNGLHDAKKTVAMVSSSALARLEICLDKTELRRFFPRVYSAADHVKNSKPEPDIYLHALHELGVEAPMSVAWEDGKSGVLASCRAGIDVVGYVGLVPAEKQDEHALMLIRHGASLVVRHWDDVTEVV